MGTLQDRVWAPARGRANENSQRKMKIPPVCPAACSAVGFCITLCRKTTIYELPAVCKVKNRLIGDFWDFMRGAQQTTTRSLFFGEKTPL
jgi:hypothetical protein